MKYYWLILRQYKKSLIISPILVLITALCETMQPWFMSKIVDDGVMHKDLSIISQFGGYMLIIALLGIVVGVSNIYVSSRAAVGFGTDLRQLIFRKIQDLSLSELDLFDPSSLITRLTNDVNRIQQVILMGLRLLLRSPFMLILATFFAVNINRDLAWILIGAIPVLGIAVFLVLWKGFPLFMQVQQKVDQLNSVVRENLINIRVVKSFVREDFEIQRFDNKADELREFTTRASNMVVMIFPIMQLVMNLSVVAILWFGGNKVIGGTLQVGELISFVNYIMQILMALMILSMVIVNISRASASSRRILEVLNTEASIKNTTEGIQNKYQIERGRLEFSHVYFHYKGGENDVLKDISFSVEQGESIAIVGATGAAKTSLVQLIPRLYDATRGEIKIDGINVKDYNIGVLQTHIGMVLQKNELFTGTIKENLLWGKPDATDEEIEKASKVAQAHSFIMSFPEGYNTILGRGGINVSGGQKQRLCIARALLRKPKILIFDDSMSAIDSDTEKKLRAELSILLKNTTVINITQRLHSMQAADRIIVLDDGKIETIGTSDELLNISPIYREIYESQQITI